MKVINLQLGLNSSRGHKWAVKNGSLDLHITHHGYTDSFTKVYTYGLLTLNNWEARYFSSKMDLLRDNKELQFKTWGRMMNHMQVQINKGEECSFMDLRGAIVNKESFGGNWKFEV